MSGDTPRNLGSYTIDREIGRGGMGVVYLGQDTSLGRAVAIKVLPAELAQNPERLQRFEREARTLASLNHPNVAGIYGVEESEGQKFLVLEYVEGENLADRLDRGGLDATEALELAAQIAAGVEAAHDAGIIHRDLKPANIVLTPEGQAKVLDFGLARADEGSSSTGSAELSSAETLTAAGNPANSPTMPGVILGTAAYMSPEQARGRRVDKRTDIWSFGVVLYEMLAGVGPFQGETATDSIGAILHKEPDFNRLPGKTPPIVRHVLTRCLQKDKKKRYRDIGDVRLELEAIDATGALAGPDAEAATGGAARALQLLGWVVAVLALLALGWVGFRGGAGSEARPRESYELALNPPKDGQWIIGSNVGWGTISPDGKMIVGRAYTSEGTGLYIRSLDGTVGRLLPRTDDAFYPFWSPDSRWVGFFVRGYLQKVEIDGGLPERVVVAPWGRGGSWHESAGIVYTPIGGGPIFRAGENGEDSRQVTDLDEDRNESAHYWPQWLPDGEHFLYFIRSQRPEVQGIYMGRVRSDGMDTERRRVVASSSAGLFVPGGDDRKPMLLWVEDGTLLAREFDWKSGELLGPTSRIAEGVRVLESQRASMASASRNGTLTWASNRYGRVQLSWFERNGAGPFPIEGPTGGNIVQLIPSLDGNWVSFVFVEEGQGDIWLYNTQTGVSRALTSTPVYEENQLWSPDSKEMLFVRNGATMRMPIDGSTRAREIMPKPADERSQQNPQDWINENWGIVFASLRDGSGTLRWFNLNDPEQEHTPILDESLNMTYAVASPQRDALLISVEEGSELNTYLVPMTVSGSGKPALGESRQKIPVDGGIQGFQWSLKGDELFLMTMDGTMTSVPVERVSGRILIGAPQALFTIPGYQFVQNFASTPDAQRFLIPADPEAKNQSIHVLVNWPERAGN